MTERRRGDARAATSAAPHPQSERKDGSDSTGRGRISATCTCWRSAEACGAEAGAWGVASQHDPGSIDAHDPRSIAQGGEAVASGQQGMHEGSSR